MSFTGEALQKLQIEYASVQGRYEQLFIGYLGRPYKTDRAREFATHGFPRRIALLRRCIRNVFEISPPDRTDIPTRDDISDATINIQAFVFNVFGSIDNLAWIWVHEKPVTKNGKPLPNAWVGLSSKNEVVRQSFSPDFQAYLKSLDPWFEAMGNFRHALAHRIPLYIPPYVVAKDRQTAFNECERLMAEAINRHDFEEYDRLSVDQMKLATFKPWMQHSFSEGQPPIVFHAQLLSDFATIEALGLKLLEELNRLS